jgi:hypothetical protein
MLKLLTIHDKTEWNFYVKNSAEYDFYHTWHYHSLDTSDSPILVVYIENENYIAFPLIKRQIPGTVYCDLTCVYGYTGPISNKRMEQLEDSLMENFKVAFLDCLKAENCVSVFSRLHIFFKQPLLLERFGGICDNGLSVVLDLSVSIEAQRKKYRQSTMDVIKRSWKRGFRLIEEKGEDAIALFFDAYKENMERIGASGYYLFNDEYFKKITNTDEYDARIFIVYDGDKVMAGTIVMLTNGIIEGHLLGTRTEYIRFSPFKFLVDEISVIGRSLGMRYYNLGSGIGYKQDTLFFGKLGFSDLTMDYKSWRFIVNPEIYQQLLDDKGIDKNLDVDFFPLYRYNPPVTVLSEGKEN